jgi:hypothetical protein
MGYEHFLFECRRATEEKLGRELTKAEFGRMCGVDEDYYASMEVGAKPPGKKLLRVAAEQAGFKFEDCLRLPVAIKRPARHQDAINEFMKALSDWREEMALDAIGLLRGAVKPKRPKWGGRTRKLG